MHAIDSHLPILLKMSGEASVLILLVLAAQWLCGWRLKPRWRHVLWLLVLLRLALPWTIPSPASLFNLLKIPVAPQAQAEPTPAGALNRYGEDAAGVATAVFSSGTGWPAWVWTIGALSLVIYSLAGQYRFRQRVRRLRSLTDGPTLSLFEDCRALMEVGTPVTLVETEAIKSPALFGYLRPRLLLPTGLVSGFSREELRHVFLHELAHIKRHDILIGWVVSALQIVHWFNPLVWLAFHRLRADRELACDALALSYARTGENESYGLTIVKLLEGFDQSVWGPGLAGILENQNQMKERIRMIAKFHKTDRGLGLAVVLLAGLTLVTLTDAQNQAKPQPGNLSDPRLEKKVEYSSQQASVQDIVRNLAEQVGLKYDWQKSFNQTDPLCRRWVWSVTIDGKTCQQALEQILKPVGLRYQVDDGVLVLSRQDEGMQNAPQPPTAVRSAEPDASQGVWAVRFKPVGDFSPKTPGEFLARIHQYATCYSGRDGEIGYFRTTKQGDKLVGSFLAYDPDQLKAALAVVPGIKVTSVEKLTQETLAEYEKSPQESLIDFNHLDASQGVWAVRFKPVGDFSPKTPGEFLAKIPIYSGQHGEIGYFRTKKQGDKLVGSFLANDPDQLKAALDALPDIKVTSVEKLTPAQLAEYEKSPQESVIDFNHLDASQGVWAVRFEPVGDFSPKTPGEFLARIHVYSGQHGEIGYFRTKIQGDELVGSFLAYDADQLKAALSTLPDIKVTSVEKLTQDQLVEYEKSPQESLPAE
jgi:beta-lactamase regulating signal transducer with metallopeptidase domain